MKNHSLILILFIVVVSLLTAFKKRINKHDGAEDKWSGTVSWIKTSKSKGKRNIPGKGIYRWNFYFTFHLDVKFVNGKGTVIRLDTTTKWEKDSLVFSKPDNKYRIEEKTTKIFCDGKENLELEVEFDDDRKNYWISFFTPGCPEFMSYTRISNMDPPLYDSSTKEHLGIQVNLPASFTGQPVGNNPNVLSGTWEERIPAPNDPGGGEIITKASWNLKKTK